ERRSGAHIARAVPELMRGSLTRAEVPLIEAEKLFEQAGPPQSSPSRPWPAGICGQATRTSTVVVVADRSNRRGTDRRRIPNHVRQSSSHRRAPEVLPCSGTQVEK